MNKGRNETISTRLISTTFVVLALAVFKPFGLGSWHWQAYVHLLVIWVLGVGVCMLTDVILKFVVGMPRSYSQGVGYIIRRNLWFQFINTPLISLVVCLYRHFVLSNKVEGNQLSWGNFLETLLIIAFCSFAIGLYWRFKFRSRYLAAELEETRLLNEQLQCIQAGSVDNRSDDKQIKNTEHEECTDNGEKTISEECNKSIETASEIVKAPITLKGTTSESITVQIPHLLYIEAVGNYVKVFRVCDGKVRSDMLRATLKQIEDDLRTFPMIVRCHRAFLVNLGQVEQIVSKSGSMQLLIKHCHESLPVSRSNVAQIKNAILQ